MSSALRNSLEIARFPLETCLTHLYLPQALTKPGGSSIDVAQEDIGSCLDKNLNLGAALQIHRRKKFGFHSATDHVDMTGMSSQVEWCP